MLDIEIKIKNSVTSLRSLDVLITYEGHFRAIPYPQRVLQFFFLVLVLVGGECMDQLKKLCGGSASLRVSRLISSAVVLFA